MMMADNPQISIEVSATGADRAKSQLIELGKAGDTASKQVNGFALAMKELVKNSQRTVEELKKANASMEGFANKAKSATAEINTLKGAMAGFSKVIIGYISLQTAQKFFELTGLSFLKAKNLERSYRQKRKAARIRGKNISEAYKKRKNNKS
jgi:predicted translin family RNA/ssDNA-binding protein